MAKFLYFRDTATSQYIVPVERLLGVDDTGSNTVVVQFEDMGGAASASVVTLNVVSGKERDVMVALLNRVHNEKSDVLIVADDVDSDYILSDISSIASIAHNQATAATGLTLGGDVTATAAAVDFDLIDNNASALSFDAAGAAGLINIVTTNSAEGVTMSGTLNVARELEYTAVSNETVEAGAGAGSATALSTTKQVSFVSTATSKSHVSLADGTIGQIKYIVHKALANAVSLVITPANLNGSSTITSDAAGRVVALMFDGTNWNVMGDVSEFVLA